MLSADIHAGQFPNTHAVLIERDRRLGIALAKDFDQAVARPIRSFFPNRQLRPQLDEVKLRHVLTMTAGFEWNEMTVPYTDPQNDERHTLPVLTRFCL